LAGIDGETLVGKLDRAGFAVASGAACSSAARALACAAGDGRGAGNGPGALRVSLGARQYEKTVATNFLQAP
jgi:cysteine desulfurase